jgi:hypothetical protein
MALKIISGLLLPNSRERAAGSAIIKFSDGAAVEGGGAKFTEVTVIGSGAFTGLPCKQISLRHIVFTDSDRSGVFPILFDASRHAFFNLDDDFVIENGNVTGLKVTWHAGPVSEKSERRSEIMEISVLIIGETK